MALVIFNQDSKIDYVPESCRQNIGEKDLFYVTLNFVNQGQVDKYRQRISRQSQGKKSNKIAEIIRSVQKQQFLDNVCEVHNCSLDTGEKITTAEQFYEVGESSLIEEIIMTMEDFSKLTDGQKKTLELDLNTEKNQAKQKT